MERDQKQLVINMIRGIIDGKISGDLRDDYLRRCLPRTEAATKAWNGQTFQIGFQFGVMAGLACLLDIQPADLEPRLRDPATEAAHEDDVAIDSPECVRIRSARSA